MASGIKSDQRITRLTPLADVLAHIEAQVKPVAPTERDVGSAYGLSLAEDIHVARLMPACAIALRDGFAVNSEAVRDANAYAPVSIPSPAFVETGDILPPGTDAILPQEAVTCHGAVSAISSPATIGDGVLNAGLDADPASPLLSAGRALCHGDIAALDAANIASVSVRTPRVAILRDGGKTDAFLDAASRWIARVTAAEGGLSVLNSGQDLESELQDTGFDAALVIGGTGSGRNDRTVNILARIGNVTCHGMAIRPGETAGLGFIADRPVLLMPGRIDAVLACWLLLGRKILDGLSARERTETGRPFRLMRKIASPLGITDVIPVSCRGDEARPLAADYLPLRALTQSEGWISVPASSEGYPAGAIVVVRPLP